MEHKTKDLIFAAINSALSAGNNILQIYSSDDFDECIKKDNSPLTKADKESHKIIEAALNEFDIPILSEEGKEIDYTQRKMWKLFWLIDPLDGTKEFIKKNGEFTVNIALIKNGSPILGVVYAPVLKKLYFSICNEGSYIIENILRELSGIDELYERARKLPVNNNRDKYIIVASRSHMNDETKNFIESIKKQKNNVDFISVGSSLKICLIAEGVADIYPRFGPTMEWDTAAGHAIVKGAGGSLINSGSKRELIYNKENLLNPYFIVYP